MGGLVKSVGSLFGGGAPAPTIAPAPTPPSQNPNDQSAIAAAAAEEMRRRAAVGRSSTVMTQGELDPANVGKKVLLGA